MLRFTTSNMSPFIEEGRNLLMKVERIKTASLINYQIETRLFTMEDM